MEDVTRTGARLRVTILAIGTQGDVQPLVALGRGLRDAGYTVRVATHAGFADLVRGQGLAFAPVVGDSRGPLESDAGRAWMDRTRSWLAFWRDIGVAVRQVMRQRVLDCLEASRDADLIVISPLAFLVGRCVAEKLGLPLVQTTYYPFMPTRTRPADIVPGWLHLGETFNLWSHRVTWQLVWQLGFRAQTNALQRRTLGLSPWPRCQPFGDLARPRDLVLCSWSSSAFGMLPDWGESIHVTGYWCLPRPTDWQPPAELVEFLRSGPPPVFVGFGSVSSPRPRETTGLVLEALARAGQRGVLGLGWGGLDGAGLPDYACAVDWVPFDWLLPRTVAAVHHGSAGTSGAAFAAGVPMLAAYTLPDQRLWGEQAWRLGVGPRPIPRQRLTVDRLAGAIHLMATDRGMRERAAALGERVRAEDGVARAVAVLQRRFGP